MDMDAAVREHANMEILESRSYRISLVEVQMVMIVCSKKEIVLGLFVPDIAHYVSTCGTAILKLISHCILSLFYLLQPGIT